MPLAHDEVVGGVEAAPAEPRQVSLYPGVAGVIFGAIVVFLDVVEIAADVAAWDTQPAHERNHDVAEVLAHAAPVLDCHVDGGVDLRALRHVAKDFVQVAVETQ